MNAILKLFLCASLSLLFAVNSFAQGAQGAQEIKVAAAADLKFAMAELSAQFEKQGGPKLQITYGSSGNFLTQIQNGAPFDIFFSADSDYPQKLEAASLTEPNTLTQYALGHLVVWSPAGGIDVSNDGWSSLTSDRVKKIAIANPQHAPYGRAAVAALKSAGIYDQIKSKLVFGENISQAAQFVQSGNAQAGLIALSLAVSPAMHSGHRWPVPPDSYPAIQQSAVVLKPAKNKDAARKFLAFVKSPAGGEILERFGFSIPAK
jgi:molybdate transport system substrate-binding protein